MATSTQTSAHALDRYQPDWISSFADSPAHRPHSVDSVLPPPAEKNKTQWSIDSASSAHTFSSPAGAWSALPQRIDLVTPNDESIIDNAARDDDTGRRRASWGLPLTPTRIPILPQPAKAPQGVRHHRHTKSLSNGSNSPRPPFFLTMSKITAEQDDKDLTNAEVDQILDVVMDDAIEMYTPRSLSSSTSSTPTWLTECSSAHSSPALSSSSPQTFMLQGFLERHSNGHIMYRKPIHCSTNCPDCRLLPPTLHLDDTDDDHDTSDQRFLLLAQSPNPSEFELSDFVSTESQKAARLHQADSPVFFNGFPLLQMAARER